MTHKIGWNQEPQIIRDFEYITHSGKKVKPWDVVYRRGTDPDLRDCVIVVSLKVDLLLQTCPYHIQGLSYNEEKEEWEESRHLSIFDTEKLDNSTTKKIKQLYKMYNTPTNYVAWGIKGVVGEYTQLSMKWLPDVDNIYKENKLILENDKTFKNHKRKDVEIFRMPELDDRDPRELSIKEQKTILIKNEYLQYHCKETGKTIGKYDLALVDEEGNVYHRNSKVGQVLTSLYYAFKKNHVLKIYTKEGKDDLDFVRVEHGEGTSLRILSKDEKQVKQVDIYDIIKIYDYSEAEYL